MVRRGLLALVAVAAMFVGVGGSPAQAAGCAPYCQSFGGEVIGSVIVPGDLFKFQGKFTSGDYPGAHFNIEGPYTRGSNGTLKINGKGAPNFKQAVVVESYAGGFRVRNASSSGQAVNATFSGSGKSYTSNDARIGGSELSEGEFSDGEFSDGRYTLAR